MAGGNILDMQDLGDGRYQATMANGTSPVFTGDAGRQAYERLRKQESAAGPNATAESGFAKGAIRGALNSIPLVGPLAGSAASALLDKKATATDAPAPRQGVTVEAPKPQPEAPPAQAAPQSAPQGQPPAPSGPTALPYAAKGVDPATGKEVTGRAVVMPDGSMMVMRQGSKGSAGGMTALGKQVYQGRLDTEAAATPLEQRAAEARQRGSELAIEQNEAQKSYLEEQRTQAMLQAQNDRDEAMAAEQHVASLQARADAAAEEYANSRMPEQSGAQKFFDGLGAAMGAFGATMGRTPNFAQEFIQQLANRRVQKWEAETNIKGAKANNLLARYKDALGDMKLAKVAAKDTLMRQAAIEADQMALSTKSEQIGNTWREMSNAAAANGLRATNEKNEAFLLSFYGNKMLNRPATAGTPGGLVPATQGSYENMTKVGFDAEANRRADEKAQLDASKAKAEGATGEKLSEKEKVYEQTAKAAYQKAVAVVQAHGGKVVDGKIVGEKFDLPLDVVPGADSGPTAGAKAALTELGSMYANMNNAGAEAGQPTKEALTPKLGTFSNEATKAQLQVILDGTYQAIKNIEQQRGPKK